MKDSKVIIKVYPVRAGDFYSAGEVSSCIRKLLKQMNFAPGIVRRVSIASYEAEMNLVIHSYGGHLCLKIEPEKILLIAEDSGPGIPDVKLAMKEGYSTARKEVTELGFGAGMGLPNIKRCADEFKIDSKVGQGTRLEACFYI